MTVIAWDGVTLAVDRGAVSGSVMHITDKFIIEQDTGIVMVGAGNASRVVELMEWYQDWVGNLYTDLEPKFPITRGAMVAELIVFNVYEPDVIERFERSSTPIRHTTACAFGEGRDFAYGAMDMGANAVQAVEVAIKRSPYCGGPIDIFTVGQKDNNVDHTTKE